MQTYVSWWNRTPSYASAVLLLLCLQTQTFLMFFWLITHVILIWDDDIHLLYRILWWTFRIFTWLLCISLRGWAFVKDGKVIILVIASHLFKSFISLGHNLNHMWIGNIVLRHLWKETMIFIWHIKYLIFLWYEFFGMQTGNT